MKSKERRAKRLPTDHDDVVEWAIQRGCTKTFSRSGHIRLHLPNGNSVSAGVSPSDRNAGKALLRNLKRRGLEF